MGCLVHLWTVGIALNMPKKMWAGPILSHQALEILPSPASFCSLRCAALDCVAAYCTQRTRCQGCGLRPKHRHTWEREVRLRKRFCAHQTHTRAITSAPTPTFKRVKKWPGRQGAWASSGRCQGSRLLPKRGTSIDADLRLQELLLDARDSVNPTRGFSQTAQQSWPP